MLDDPDYGFSHQDFLMRLLIEAAMFRHVQTSTENKARRFIKTAEGYLHAGKKSNGGRKEGESVNLKTTFILWATETGWKIRLWRQTLREKTEVLQEHSDFRSMMKKQKKQARPEFDTKGFLNPCDYARHDVGEHSWRLHRLICNAQGRSKKDHTFKSHPDLQDGWWQPHTRLAFQQTGGRFKKGNGLSTSACFHSFPSSDLTRTLAETWLLSRSFPNAFGVGWSWLWWLGSSFCPTYGLCLEWNTAYYLLCTATLKNKSYLLATMVPWRTFNIHGTFIHWKVLWG